MTDIDVLLRHLVEQSGSDLHLKVGSVPHLRVQGRLRAIPFDAPRVEDLEHLVGDLVPTSRTRELAERGEVSIAHAVPGLGRFRLDVYRQRGTYAMAMRLIAPGVPALDALGLPAQVGTLAELDAGLVLVTGPAASGKTTTAAAMLDHVNRTRKAHIVTLEDPIEVLLADHSSMVSQREIGIDARDTAEALRRVNRLDPDVIFVSELGDAETIGEVLAVAGAGRLVIAVVTAATVAAALADLLAKIEVPRQARVRHVLASVLQGVVGLRLLESADGTGLVPAVEVLTATPEVTAALTDGAGADELAALMGQGADHGMQAMDQALIALVRAGSVTSTAAVAASAEPDRLAAMLAATRSA